MDPRGPRAPVQVGDRAPDFALPAVGREGVVSLADYRGRSPVFLAINRGLWCSFCRRYLVQLTGAREKLQGLGVEVLVIVATPRESAEFYVARRPVRLPLAADPEVSTHQAYGLSLPPMTPEMEQTWAAMRLRLDQTAFSHAEAAELAAAVPSARGNPAADVPLNELRAAQAALYPHELSESETQDRVRYITQSTGQFLVDRQGVVRWSRVQGVTDLPATLGNFPNEAEILAAAHGLTA